MTIIVRLVQLVMVMLAWLPISASHAAAISGDMSAPANFVPAGNGTTALFVYSERTAYTGTEAGCTRGAAPPNSDSQHYTFPDGGYVARPIPVATTDGGTMAVAIHVGPRSYDPALSAGTQPKRTAPLEGDVAWSASGERNRCKIFGIATVLKRLGKLTVSAKGMTNNFETSGKAAAAAFDPYDVMPGSYLYDHPISLNMDFDNDTDRGDVELLATDSRLGGEPLWTLTVGANGNVGTADQVEIAFRIYPGAQKSILSTSTGEPVDEAEIIARVRAALIVTHRHVSLPEEFALFLPDTFYHVVDKSDSAPSTQYGFGSKAGLDAAGSGKPVVDWGEIFPRNFVNPK